jgi:thiamine-monophosphate kinase
MIDISDGLAADVFHLCEESKCGAVLHAETIPITISARLSTDGRSPLEHALADGEDFELVFAVAPEEAQRLLQSQPIAGITLAMVGECVEEGLWLEDAGGRKRIEPRGYVHHFE